MMGSTLAWAAVSLAGAGIVVWSSIRGYKAGATAWTAWRRPLLHGISDAQLRSVGTHWPSRETRWPVPTNVGDGAMSAVVALAYARLAERARRRTVIAAQGLGLVAGAWLGTSLPWLWKLLSSPSGLSLLSWDYAQLLCLMAVSEAALLVADSASDYEDMGAVYRRYAHAPTANVSALELIGQPWWERLLAKLR